jgi:hypothetical protein
LGLFNTGVHVERVPLQQLGWKCSNIAGFVSGFTRVESFFYLPFTTNTRPTPSHIP